MKIDIGCGPNKKEGFFGVDIIKFDGVDQVFDIRLSRWPWEDNSVDEIYSSHFVEHLEARERVSFVNESYRVLKAGAKMELRFPHWSSAMAYGDLTHKWPPVSEFWFNYLNREWRLSCAPHDDISNNKDGYNCNFSSKTTLVTNENLDKLGQDVVSVAAAHWKDVVTEMRVELTKI